MGRGRLAMFVRTVMYTHLYLYAHYVSLAAGNLNEETVFVGYGREVSLGQMNLHLKCPHSTLQVPSSHFTHIIHNVIPNGTPFPT